MLYIRNMKGGSASGYGWITDLFMRRVYVHVWVLLNFGRTEKMWAVCGGKINILPTFHQYTKHKEPTYCPTPHLLNGVNVERMLIVSRWSTLWWARCGEVFEEVLIIISYYDLSFLIHLAYVQGPKSGLQSKFNKHPGRRVKELQKGISPNHVRAIFSASVKG